MGHADGAMRSVKTTNKPFAAVSIQPSTLGSCEAAREIGGVRYLSQEAPPLPLQDCSHPERCRCKYKHWDDRRQDDDRRSPIPGIAADLHAADDRRRAARDRRKS